MPEATAVAVSAGAEFCAEGWTWVCGACASTAEGTAKTRAVSHAAVARITLGQIGLCNTIPSAYGIRA